MSVNRFWNKAAVAEYTPRTMQEMAYAPQIMYQRDQDLTAKVDAMNEASATLKSMLGDKAGKSEQFDAGYKQMLEGISKYGATPQMLDKAKALKQSYIKEVLPQEAYAKKREQIASAYMKDTSNANNIIVGNNPLEVSFDQYQKDPNAMQYQVAERDKLLQHGAAIGSQWAKSNVKQTPDKYGRIVNQKGFSSAEEAMNAYKADPNFKQWVDDQTVLATKAAGLASPNEDALNSIKSGIMTTVVGGLDYDRNYAFDPTGQRVGMGGLNKQASVQISANEVGDTGIIDLKDDESIKRTINTFPGMKKVVDGEVKSGSGYNSLEELDGAISNIKKDLSQTPTMESFQQAYNPGGERSAAMAMMNKYKESGKDFAGDAANIRIKQKKLSELEDTKKIVLDNVRNSQSLKTFVDLSPDITHATQYLGEQGAALVKRNIEAIGEDLVGKAPNFTSQNEDWSIPDSDNFKWVKDKFNDPETIGQKVLFKSLKVNQLTGEPFFSVRLEYAKDKGKKSEGKDMLIRVPPMYVNKALTLFNNPTLLGGNDPKNDSRANTAGMAAELVDQFYGNDQVKGNRYKILGK